MASAGLEAEGFLQAPVSAIRIPNPTVPRPRPGALLCHHAPSLLPIFYIFLMVFWAHMSGSSPKKPNTENFSK